MAIAHKTIQILIALLLTSPLAAEAAEELDIEELAAISHEITYINSFGTWQEGNKQGRYRIIVVDAVRAPGHSKVYLQWVEEKPDKNGEIIISLAPVLEINDVGVYRVSEPRIITESDGANVVEFVAVNQYSNASHNIRLVMGDAGHYEFRFVVEPYSQDIDRAVNAIPLRLDKYKRPGF